MSRVLDLGEDQAGALSLLAETIHRGGEGPAEEIVGQHHEGGLVADELRRKPERLGNPARPLLIGVEEAFDAELMAVGEKPEELAGMGPTGHDHDLGDPGLDEGLDPVADHGPVADRQQVLVGDPGEREQPAAGPAGEDDAPHGLR